MFKIIKKGGSVFTWPAYSEILPGQPFLFHLRIHLVFTWYWKIVKGRASFKEYIFTVNDYAS